PVWTADLGPADNTSLSHFPFPDPTSAYGIDDEESTRQKLIAWEIATMLQRRDERDFKITSTSLIYGAPRSTLFELDVSTEPRAVYSRFGVRLKSRYPGIKDADITLDAVLPMKSASGSAADAIRTKWRRVWVPCRREGTLPKPAVRMIVP